MTTSWVAPLTLSAVVALLLTPAARRLAVTVGLVDRPAAHKSHRRVTPYLGGIAIAVAVIAGRLTHLPGRQDAITTGLAAVLAVMGLIDDSSTLPAFPRFAVELACACGAVAAGLHLTGTGVYTLDVVLSVLLLAGVTNATNFLDNLDGLAAGVVAAGAAGAAILAGLGGQTTTMADGASLVGACLAFLVFNARPASIFMGDAGSLFIGFLFAALAIQAGRPLPEPTGLVVTALIVALPVADTTTVTFARLRHHRSPLRGGRDHLSHRLAGTGMGAGPAVALLVAVEGLLSAAAVAVGRGAIPSWGGAAAGLGLILLVVLVASRSRVYRDSEPPRLPRAVSLGLPLLVLVLAGLAVPASLGMLRARNAALAGQTALQNAVTAARSGQLGATSSYLQQAQAQLAAADSDMSGPLCSFGLGYPVLAGNLRAARTIVSTGLALARSGRELIAANQSYHRWISGGSIDLVAVERAQPGLSVAARLVDGAYSRVARLPRGYLVGPIARATQRATSSLATAKGELDGAASTATYLPALLGAGGPRRYFLAVQNPDENRGTGGFIGNWGLLEASSGHLHLAQFGRTEQLDSGGDPGKRTIHGATGYLARYAAFDPAQDWQNVNMAADFPTVASVISDLYPQSGGQPVDGVIAVDPAGLAALLQLTGPVTVAGWPTSIDAGNVAQVTLYSAYLSYPDEAARVSFLGDVARAAFDAFTQLHVTDLSGLVSALRPAIAGRHLQLYSAHPAEEEFFRRAGVSGELPPIRSDSLAFTTQNVAANKIDYFLNRSLDYQLTLKPSGSGGVPSQASAQGDVRITLRNGAPASGLPASLVGPYESQFRAGEESTFFSLYSPLGFDSATLDGQEAGLMTGTETARNVYSTFVNLDAGQSRTLDVQLSGTLKLLAGGWYELDLPHQPGVNTDQVTVRIDVPGARILAVRGASPSGTSEATATFTQDSDRAIEVQLGS